MKGRNNGLLIELIIVIFFFSISTVVSLQVFAEAYSKSHTSIQKTYALIEIESWAERISKVDDLDGLLQEWGGDSERAMRIESDDGYYLSMEYETEETSAGKLIHFVLSAYDTTHEEEPLLLSMPVALYLPGSGETT